MRIESAALFDTYIMNEVYRPIRNASPGKRITHFQAENRSEYVSLSHLGGIPSGVYALGSHSHQPLLRSIFGVVRASRHRSTVQINSMPFTRGMWGELAKVP
jgi:hypothetical protein